MADRNINDLLDELAELDNDAEINREAEDLLAREAEEDARYAADLENLMNEISEIAKNLQGVQQNIQKRTSKKAKEKLGIAYEITDEKLKNPQENLTNLDELKDMENYYYNLFTEANEKAKTEKKWGDRRYNRKLANDYQSAYDMITNISGKLSAFMEKYKDRLEAEQVLANDGLDELENEKPLEPTEPETTPKKDGEEAEAPKPDPKDDPKPNPEGSKPKPKKKPAVKKSTPKKDGEEAEAPKPDPKDDPKPNPEGSKPKPKKKPAVKKSTPKKDGEEAEAPKPDPKDDPKPETDDAKPSTEGDGDAKKSSKPSLLKNIDPKYYGQIFKLINNTVVIGSKYKYNTLDYLEYELNNASIEKMQELGFPVDDPEKANLIKKVCLKFVKASKEIRKDQWLTQGDERKQGNFEARKHSTQESIIDRNKRLMKRFRISKAIAEEYGLATSVEDLKNDQTSKQEAKQAVTNVKDDPIFVKFYEDFKQIYKLGSPTSESNDVLYKVHRELTEKKDENSFGLKGESLKAAKLLVEQTIIARRNSWKNGKKASQAEIEEAQKDLGM